jgi:hypothetical protein
MRVPAILLLLATACTPAPTHTAPDPNPVSDPDPDPDPHPDPAPDPDPDPDPAPDPDPDPDPAPPILTAHNRYRADHCAAALTWSAPLAAEAQRWADSLAARGCAFEHNPKTRDGENLAFFGPPGSVTEQGVAEMWYRERDVYDFDRPGFSFEAGHFTQLVWRRTTELGCGSVTCGDGELWVCNYAPAGNVEGDFERNVLPRSCKK